MSISIIIPNYNGEALLRKNLPAVYAAIQEYKQDRAEVIVVDDNSKDESIKEVKNQKAKVKSQKLNLKVIENKKNLGFALAVNRGVEEAKGDIIILLNSDVRPQKDFLKALLPHFKNPQVFAVGCLDKSIEDKNFVLRGRGVGRFVRGFLVHQRGEVNKTDTLWVSGGSGAFQKKIWEKLGGFDKLYKPFYWEDIDLSYRALKSGYKILFEPKSQVIHEHEAGAIKTHYQSSLIKIIAYRNQFIFVWKNITDFDKQFLHFLWLPYHLLAALLRGDFYFWIGFFLALLKFPKVIKESFRVQRLFTRTDREVLSLG